MAKDMYQKYPDNFELMHYLGDLIVENMNSISENIELLKEIHRKIMSGCTDEEYRRSSIHRMCYAATDDELEEMANNCLLKWRELLPLMVDEYGELDGWAPKPIATTYIK